MDNITDYRILKRDMMKLWKDTFHDSDRYIRLVFETYFTPENVFARYYENRLIASLLCIPYEFQILTKEEKKTNLSGMYLCGLATDPDFRKRGIMSELMREAERSATAREFDFTFLIPADSHLRGFYSRKGYVNASYRKTTKQTLDHNHLERRTLNIYSIKDLIISDKTDLVIKLADWCREKELRKNVPTIVHSQLDMIAIMTENENSIFLTEETFDLKYPILAKVVAVAFPELSDEREESLKIVGLYTDMNVQCPHNDEHTDNEICKHIEKALCQHYPGRSVEFKLPYEGGLKYDKSGVEPYAMVKTLTANKREINNLTFQIYLMMD